MTLSELKMKLESITESLFDDLPTQGDCNDAKEELAELIQAVSSDLLPIESFDADEWFGKNKDIWNHPRIFDRTEKKSYKVADLMAEFANQFFRK